MARKKVSVDDARSLLASLNGGGGAVKGPVTAYVAVFDCKRWPGQIKIAPRHGDTIGPPMARDVTVSRDAKGKIIERDGAAQILSKFPALADAIRNAEGKSGIVGMVNIKTGKAASTRGVKLPKRFTVARK